MDCGRGFTPASPWGRASVVWVSPPPQQPWPWDPGRLRIHLSTCSLICKVSIEVKPELLGNLSSKCPSEVIPAREACGGDTASREGRGPA